MRSEAAREAARAAAAKADREERRAAGGRAEIVGLPATAAAADEQPKKGDPFRKYFEGRLQHNARAERSASVSVEKPRPASGEIPVVPEAANDNAVSEVPKLELEWIGEPTDAELQSMGTPEGEQMAQNREMVIDAAFKAIEATASERHRPQFLARGGEHAVYAVRSGNGNTMVKANLPKMRWMMTVSQARFKEPGHLSPETRTRYEKDIDNTQRRLKDLQNRFGREHVLPFIQRLAKVPVSPEVMDFVHAGPEGTADDMYRNAPEAWTVLTIQQKAKEISGEHTCVMANYAELHSKDPESYLRTTAALVDLIPDAEVYPQDVVNVLPPELGRLLIESKNDGTLRDTLRDFAEKAIAYTRETGDILDIAGEDNVTLFKKDGKWTYRLVDAVFTVENVATKSFRAIQKLEANKDLDTADRAAILNTSNYARGLNAIAMMTGSEERLEAVPPSMKGKVDYYSTVKELLPKQE